MDLECFVERENHSFLNTEKVCKQIVQKVEKRYQVSFDMEKRGISYRNMFALLLLNSNFSSYRSYVLFLLSEFQVRESTLLFWFISLLRNRYHSKVFQKRLESMISQLSFVQKFERNKKDYYLETTMGSLTFSWLPDTVHFDITEILKKYDFQGKCHHSLPFFKEYFPNAHMVTSEIPELFGGIFYHSYFVEEGHVFDMANLNDCNQDLFTSFLHVEELSNLPVSSYDEKIKTIGTIRYAPVLQLAFEESRKKR